MRQLSLFDLPTDSKQGADGPRLWWAIQYKPWYERAVSDFREMYGVGPIFFLEWPKYQVFLREPSAPLIIERSTGRLAKPRTGVLWRTDYREVKAFRPADVAPLIAEILAGGSPCFWDDE